MTTTSSPRSDIQTAEHALRDVVASGLRDDAPETANTLERMLVHVTNMQSAVETTPSSLPNVAKRLRDFSVTTTRLAGKHPKSAEKLEWLAQALRTAGEQVTEATMRGDGSRADAA